MMIRDCGHFLRATLYS